ncbi:MAG TPA: hypothetical protein PLD47_06310 [Aggregatilineales bacterium]|nr:hypothetical protein [Anaerolineales bacterium]HRE47323.1 hypothetical protein [Aggregatilineales bacterium]
MPHRLPFSPILIASSGALLVLAALMMILAPVRATAQDGKTPFATPTLGQWCRHSAECGGEGLVCQCPYSLPKDKGGAFQSGTRAGWTLDCPVMQYVCIDRNHVGYTYYARGFVPTLDTLWRPPGDFAVMDAYYGKWEGIHPDLIAPLTAFLDDPEVQTYLTDQGLVVFFASAYRGDDRWSQHASGRAVDLYLTRRDHVPGTRRQMISIEPLRGYLFKYGFIFPTYWDGPHYYYPDNEAQWRAAVALGGGPTLTPTGAARSTQPPQAPTSVGGLAFPPTNTPRP